MNNKKYISLALSTVLAIGTITPAFAAENSNKVKKDETVYVLMNDKGKIKEETVSVWLHSDDKINLKDKTNLKDIRNLKGDEEPKRKGNTIHWKSNKKDIYYQGQSTKALPVDIKVTYKLNGKKTSLKKLEGKSGKLEIIIEAENKEKFVKNINGKNETLYTPYIVAGGLSLSTDKFKNVESNGKILDDGKTQAVGFSLFPGMAETFADKLDTLDVDIYDYIEDKITVTADVKKFERPVMLFTVADLFQTDPEFKEFDSFDELTDALEELDDKGQEMLDGAIELKDGSIEFSDAIYDLVDAHKELYDGSNDLYDGANSLQASMEDALEGTKLLSSGSQDLNDGAKKLNSGLYDLISGINTLDEKMEDLTDGAKKLKDGTDELVNGTGTLNDGAKAFKAAYDEYSVQIPGYVEKAQEVEKNVSDLEKGSENIGAQLDALRKKIKSKMTEEQSQEGTGSGTENGELAKQTAAIKKAIIELENMKASLEGVSESLKGEPISISVSAKPEGNSVNLNEIKESITALQTELSGAKNNLPEEYREKLEIPEEGLNNLKAAIGNMENSAQAPSDENTKQVLKDAKDLTIKLNSASATVSAQAKMLEPIIKNLREALNYDMSDIGADVDKIIASNKTQTVALGVMLEQMQAVNQQIKAGQTKLPTLNEKIVELTDGIDKLYEGSKELQEGTGELYDGTLKLQDGVSQLKDGADKLYDGSTQLQEGTQAAVDGTKGLDEGLNKLQLEGVSPLKDGVGKLSGGLASLYNKSPDLTEAADDLVDGTEELADGVNKYMDEGIKKMRSEVTEKTDDVDDIMAMRDELVRISQENDSFTGKPEGVETKVKYVIKYE